MQPSRRSQVSTVQGSPSLQVATFVEWHSPLRHSPASEQVPASHAWRLAATTHTDGTTWPPSQRVAAAFWHGSQGASATAR